MCKSIYSTVLLILFFAFVLFLIGALDRSAHAQVVPQKTKTYKFTNGNWFDGKNFKWSVFYSVGGYLTYKKPPKVDETIDLENGFVIPPFADAHTHNLDGIHDLDKISKAYLEEGTFYVQVLGNNASGAEQARPLLNKPSTLDVSYANGSLTCTYGHPFMVYEPLAMGIYNFAEGFRRIEEVKNSRHAENDAYWFLDSKADVDAKWKKILAAAPDIIKIMIIEAENYEKYTAADDKLNKGLSPEVAEYIVQKAHKAGLRVFAHIETANDFRLGLKIGVDGFAHAPYYGWNGAKDSRPQDDLTVKDIKLTAQKNAVVIPTAQRGIYSATDYVSDGIGVRNQKRFRQIVDRQKKLFNQMNKNGVKLAFGLDTYGTTLGAEIWYFHDNKIFDNQTLLKIATKTTAQTIFPNRKIGELREGYEANFLVLNGNPVEDFKQIKNIKLRFKQGLFVRMEDANSN